jgi:5S rRNA maturation endonuclease (ribonuclease M5)
MDSFRDVLLEIGYSNIVDNGRELRMRPIYRDSSSNTVLSVRKDTGYFIDFSRSINGSFEYLVQLSLGLKEIGDAKQWLSKNGATYERKVENVPTLSTEKILSPEPLKKLFPDHSYWIDRGISEETIRLFRGGVMKDEGRMKNRYVFPVFNRREQLVGVTGRYLYDIPKTSNVPKWKHWPSKKNWKYPLFFNSKEVAEKKEIIVIESIGDMLALWDTGIKNTIVTFGLDINKNMLNTMLKFQIKKIILSFNNDDASNEAGNQAAEKNRKKLLRYFDNEQVKICFPTKNDFGDMSKEEIKNWHNNLHI